MLKFKMIPGHNVPVKSYMERFYETVSMIYHGSYCYVACADKETISEKHNKDCPNDVSFHTQSPDTKWGRSATFTVYLTHARNEKHAMQILSRLRFGFRDNGKEIAPQKVQWSPTNQCWYFVVSSYDLNMFLYKLGFRAGFPKETSQILNIPTEYSNSWIKGAENVVSTFRPKPELYVLKALKERQEEEEIN